MGGELPVPYQNPCPQLLLLLLCPENYNQIDAYVCVRKGDPSRIPHSSDFEDPETERQFIRGLLASHPPDIVLFHQPRSAGYGFHNRAPEKCGYIYLHQ
jgi:hypothetical protein